MKNNQQNRQFSRNRPKYIAVEEYDPITMTISVNQYIDDGYKPTGGLSICIDSDGITVYVQALYDPW